MIFSLKRDSEYRYFSVNMKVYQLNRLCVVVFDYFLAIAYNNFITGKLDRYWNAITGQSRKWNAVVSVRP